MIDVGLVHGDDALCRVDESGGVGCFVDRVDGESGEGGGHDGLDGKEGDSPLQVLCVAARVVRLSKSDDFVALFWEGQVRICLVKGQQT